MKSWPVVKSGLSVLLAMGLLFSPWNVSLSAQSARLLDETPAPEEVITDDGGESGEISVSQQDINSSDENQPLESPAEPAPENPIESETQEPLADVFPAAEEPVFSESAEPSVAIEPAAESTPVPEAANTLDSVQPAIVDDPSLSVIDVVNSESPESISPETSADTTSETVITPESDGIQPENNAAAESTASESAEDNSVLATGNILVRYTTNTNLEDLIARLAEQGYAIRESDLVTQSLLLDVPAGLEDVLAGQIQTLTGVQSAGAAYEASALDLIPNDPLYSQQTYLSTIKSPGGWQYFTGSSETIIAVIDTGIDLANPEFAGRLVEGYDFVNQDTDAMDDNGHGTHVAGTVAATGNNGTGIAGLDWSAKIMPIKVLNSAGKGTESQVYNGIMYAVNHGAKIINLSLGFNGYSEMVADAVAYANKHGVTIVAAGGNSGSTSITFPASLPQVIAVGSVNDDETHSFFSNTGKGLDVVAPGVNILSTNLDGPTFKTGTSMSTAQVTGLVSLLKGIYPLSTAQIERNLQVSSKDLGKNGWDSYFGYGMIQVKDSILQLFGFMSRLGQDREGEETQTTPVFHPTFTPTPTFIPLQ